MPNGAAHLHLRCPVLLPACPGFATQAREAGRASAGVWREACWLLKVVIY